VGLLLQQVPQSSAISVLVATVLCALLWPIVGRARLESFWLVIVLLSGMRFALVQAYRRRAADADARPWERRFVVTLVMTGVAWGVGGWLLMPRESVAYQAVVYFFLMGMAGGAVANYSAHIGSVTATIVMVMLPSTLWFALQDNPLTRAMALGAMIYVVAAFRAAKTFSTALRRSIQLTHELQAARAAAELQARTDELTGMRNRRAFNEQGELAMAQARRYGDALALISLDIDHFKGINDTWGHAAGDETLRVVAAVVEHTIRDSDVAARVGGEEFAILLPRASPEQAAAMAERLRVAMEQSKVSHDGREFRFTASFGVASRGAETDTLDRLLAQADQALYEAKAGGRNRVVRR
jgi:diguanylate cyclase (GGDEF)-like protein